MKNIIAALIAIFIAVTFADKENVEDYRFTKDGGRKFVGTLVNGKNLRFAVYHHNNDYTKTYQTVADLERTCGPYEKHYNILKQSNSYSVKVIPLSEDKILITPLSLSGHGYHVFINDVEIVDLSSCTVTQVSLPSKTKKPILEKIGVTVRADSFDMFFEDPELCENSVCKQSYDFQGKKISTPIVEYGPFTVVPNTYAIGSQLHSSGEIAVGKVHDKTTAFLVKDGAFKRLQQFKSLNLEFFPVVSTSNNLITFADLLENGTSLNVTRFDLDGKLKFETVLDFGELIGTAHLLNAPNGYAYVMVTPLNKEANDKKSLPGRNIVLNNNKVKKVDANGKVVGSFLMKFSAPANIIKSTFYNDGKSYCTSVLDESAEEYFTKAGITSKCFKDADLS